jgi:hypothetical protein
VPRPSLAVCCAFSPLPPWPLPPPRGT